MGKSKADKNRKCKELLISLGILIWPMWDLENELISIWLHHCYC